MYHYYVRYSVYNKEGEKIDDAAAEVSLEAPILYLLDIEKICDGLKDEVKNCTKPDAETVIIDFYNFLRQE